MSVGNKFCQWRHINFFTFKKLFEQIDAHISRPSILETGSSAYGTNSSVLFATLAASNGGSFDTVDLNPQTTEKIRAVLKESFGDNPDLRCHTGDSVKFIKEFSGNPNIIYLDSYDLIPGSFLESARHGLKEFEGIISKIDHEMALILIDDTPKTYEIFKKMINQEFMIALDDYKAQTGRLPGKGELIVENIKGDHRFEILEWEYQVLIKYKP